jgi:hypothetical protein
MTPGKTQVKISSVSNVLVTPQMAAQMLGIPTKKYRSIDDPWEDSSEEVVPRLLIPLKLQFWEPGQPLVIKPLQPKEKYYYTARVHKLDGTVEAQSLCVGKNLHEMIMKAMVADEDDSRKDS